MCIVVDPPLFVPIFKTSHPEHGVYGPVLAWICSGHGKFVLGGSIYFQELGGVRSVLPHLAELERRGKIVRRDTAAVDKQVALARAAEPCKDFDDPHLVGLVRESGCKLICISDPRSHKYLRDVKLYRSFNERPKLYTRETNHSLLCLENVAACCK